jgi:hypothetical protein
VFCSDAEAGYPFRKKVLDALSHKSCNTHGWGNKMGVRGRWKGRITQVAHLF